MTEKYAHLAPENLVDAVSSIEDRLHFGSTLGYPPLFDIRNFSYIPGIKRGEGFCLPLSLESNEVMRKCAEGHLLKISKFST